MKILTVVSHAYPVRGGAAITHLTFLKRLSDVFSHECSLYTDYVSRRTATFDRVKVKTFRDLEELKEMVRELRPDVVIAALDLIHNTLKITKWLNIPTLAYLNSYEYCPPTMKEKKTWKVSLDKLYPSKEERDFALRQADAVLVVSDYLRERLKKRYGIDSEVIRQQFEPQRFLLENFNPSRAEYIAGVCGYAYKGTDIFLELAKSFKNEKFLLVGNVDPLLSGRLKAQKNITFLPYCETKNFLKKSRIVLVPSVLPEALSRTAVESMANGIPTLVSYSGGMKELVKGSSLGVRNFRKIDAWQKELSKLLGSPEAYRLNACECKNLSAGFLGSASLEKLEELMKILVKRKRPNFKTRKVAAVCGATDKKTAYSVINSRFFRILNKDREFFPFIIQNSRDFYPCPVDYFIHHDYQGDFGEISPPEEGKFVAVRTWDFGKFPEAWVEKINSQCDQLWVYSNWTRRQAISSGIIKNRIKVIPPGIDPKIFSPAGRAYPLPGKEFRFLFVGATVLRKGIDILLDAYLKAFGPDDEVCLVIKDNPKDIFYSGINYRKKIKELTKDKKHPRIVYLDSYLTEEELASLYRACDAGVFPYRAEGFSMPILEAMACGIPSLVPNFGACLDFCSASTSYLLPIIRVNLPVGADFAFNTLGFKEKVDEVDFCEIEVNVLADFLKKVIKTPKSELGKKSVEGIKISRNRFTWDATAAALHRQLKALDGYKIPVRLKKNRVEGEKNRNIFEAAREIYVQTETDDKSGYGTGKG